MTLVLSMSWALAGLVTGAFGWHVPEGVLHPGYVSFGVVCDTRARNAS